MPLQLATAWWGIGAILVAIDVYFSLAPPGQGTALLPDKLVHFTTYFLLGLWFVALAARHRVVALVGVVVLGGALELLQGLTPARQPEWLDLAANSAGALLAFVILKLLNVQPFAWLEARLLKAS